ncbi:MAG: restriction endonuclease subunit S [Bacteroidota bacterium]|nr:restriction endonuclease subunit S [Bacteroidota bacterium]
MKSNYKPIGSYITRVEKRNSDLKVTKLLGLSMTKEFRETTSNIVGTDMSVYRVMKKWQFACDFMSPIRVNKLPVVLKMDDEPNIVSPAYPVFEVVNKETLDPEYLMMWFRRPEFDRYATFKCDAAIRGGYDWEALCETLIPVPSIFKQKEIVKEYNTIVNRIELNNKLIQKLEETAQAIYKQWFVDFEFPDENGKPYKSSGGEMEMSDELEKEIPVGWEVKSFTQVLNLGGGGTPDTTNEKYWGGEIPFFAPPDVSESYYSITTEKTITEKGLKNCSSKLYPKDTIFVTARGTVGAIAIAGRAMAMNQSCYAINDTKRNSKFFAHQLTIDTISRLKNEATGAVFSALVTRDFDGQKIIEPIENLILKFDVTTKGLYSSILNTEKENACLSSMKDLLLSKLATIEN